MPVFMPFAPTGYKKNDNLGQGYGGHMVGIGKPLEYIEVYKRGRLRPPSLPLTNTSTSSRSCERVSLILSFFFLMAGDIPLTVKIYSLAASCCSCMLH